MTLPEAWKCETCLWACVKNKTKKDWLLCKRYPPRYNQERDKSFFPDVHSQDGCGEFKNKGVADKRTR